MSSRAQRPREWRCYVEDMIAFSEKTMSYTAGMDQTAFVDDGLVYDATLRNLELIGEAATHIRATIRDGNPDVAWREIIGMRNRLIQGYTAVDNDAVWTVIQDAIPGLLPALRRILDTPE